MPIQNADGSTVRPKYLVLGVGLLSATLIAFGALCLVGAVWLLLAIGNWDRVSQTPTDRIRQLTESLLYEVRTPPTKGVLTGTSTAASVCGSWLPEILYRNNGQYTIDILGVFGDGASPSPGGTGAINAVVRVDFPDKSQVEMQFYAYTLEICRLL